MKDKLFATNDFKETIRQTVLNKNDDFLRPCRWLAYSKEHQIVVLLSGFEANQVMNDFCSGIVSLIKILPRMRQEQRIQIYFNNVKIPEFLLQPLAIFSGSLYLYNVEEQTAYLDFLGFRPNPRTKEEEDLFQKGQIRKNGYVLPIARSIFKQLDQQCRFKEDPYKLVTKLTEVRNYGVVPSSAHHNHIFQSGKKP